jgi:hypothetical protein
MVLEILGWIGNGIIETVIALLLIVGSILTIAGLIGTIIPFIDKFMVLAVQVVGVVLLCAGIFFRAGHSVEEHWLEKVREVEAKVAAAVEESKKVTVVTETVYVDRIQTVREYVTKWKDRIVERKVEINAKCTVDPIAIDVINDAARGTGVTSK